MFFRSNNKYLFEVTKRPTKVIGLETSVLLLDKDEKVTNMNVALSLKADHQLSPSGTGSVDGSLTDTGTSDTKYHITAGIGVTYNRHALKFDGSQNAWVSLGKDVVFGGSPFSISLWGSYSSFSEDWINLLSFFPNSQSEDGIYIANLGQDIYVNFFGAKYPIAIYAANVNVFYHFVLMCTPPRSCSLFSDGTLIGNYNLERGLWFGGTLYDHTFSYVAGLGKSSYDYFIPGLHSNYFHGQIADFRLFFRELTSDEVTAIYTNSTYKLKPSFSPTVEPSRNETMVPSLSTNLHTTFIPSVEPTFVSMTNPSFVPYINPTVAHLAVPSEFLTKEPSFLPSNVPTLKPGRIPTVSPHIPSVRPTFIPTVRPTLIPSVKPSFTPSIFPTVVPTKAPSFYPSVKPSNLPSVKPSFTPSTHPSRIPSKAPLFPSVKPTTEPTGSRPSITPSLKPSRVPSKIPSFKPSAQPVPKPSIKPTIRYNLGNLNVLSDTNAGLSSASYGIVFSIVLLVLILVALCYHFYRKKIRVQLLNKVYSDAESVRDRLAVPRSACGPSRDFGTRIS